MRRGRRCFARASRRLDRPSSTWCDARERWSLADSTGYRSRRHKSTPEPRSPRGRSGSSTMLVRITSHPCEARIKIFASAKNRSQSRANLDRDTPTALRCLFTSTPPTVRRTSPNKRKTHLCSEPCSGRSKINLMISPYDPVPDDPHTGALFSAVVGRDGSFRTEISPDTWKVCRARRLGRDTD